MTLLICVIHVYLIKLKQTDSHKNASMLKIRADQDYLWLDSESTILVKTKQYSVDSCYSLRQYIKRSCVKICCNIRIIETEYNIAIVLL